MKAFLLAAGLGTRLKPFTDHHPKALAKVNDKTLLEWNIQKLQHFGINEFVINIHYLGSQIVDFLEANNGFGSRFHISDERDALLDTGGALWKAQSFFTKADHILMMNVDILSNIDLKAFIHFHMLNHPLATLAVQDRISARKLIFEETDNEDLVLKAWHNESSNIYKPEDFSTTTQMKALSFSGMQIINPDIFTYMERTGKFSIIDVYLELMQQHTIMGFDHTGDIMIDVGKPESIAMAEKIFTS